MARISLCSLDLEVVYDQLVMPEDTVTNYITNITGLNESTYKNHPYKTLDEV